MEIKKEKINLVNTIKSIVKKDENLQEWQEYKIGDLFKIMRGKNSKNPKTKGNIPFISSTSTNNGIHSFIEYDEIKIIDGNTITVANNGSVGETFYQKNIFSASSDVSILILKDKLLTENIAMFLIPIIKKIGHKYNYGVKWSLDKMREDFIKLPSKWNDEFEFEPDWEYMNNYISDLKKEIKLNQIKKQINNIELIRKEELNINEWQEYVISDIFEGKTGDVDIQNKDINDRGIFVITSGVKNSGILGKTDIDAKIFKKNTITIDMFGNVFYRGYDYKMATHGRVFSIRTIDVNTNKFHNIFLTSVLNNIFPFIFSYGHMCSWNRVKDFKIKLPSKWNDEFEFEPDWEYMNKYISDLEKEINQ